VLVIVGVFMGVKDKTGVCVIVGVIVTVGVIVGVGVGKFGSV